jgi:WD40 repeat protein
VISAGWDGDVRQWRPADLHVWSTLSSAHDDVIYDVAWSPQGFSLITASWDGTVRNWHARDLALFDEFAGHTGRVQRVVWNPAGTHVATLGWDDTVRVWNVNQGEQVAVRHEHMDFIVWVGWTDANVRVLTLDGRLLVWDTESGSLLDVTQDVSADGLPALRTQARGVTFDIDDGGVVRLMRSGGEDAALLGALPGRANAAAWSPDGARLAAAVRNGTITIWKVE